MKDEHQNGVEPGEIDAYMDPEGAGKDGLSDEHRRKLYLTRYDAIREEYRVLMCLRAEFDATKNEEGLANVRRRFETNYKARKFLVRELRLLGEKLEDRFVPG